MAKTYTQIQQQIKDLQAQADRLRKKEADGVLARIQEAISVYGFTAKDFTFPTDSGTHAPGNRKRKANGAAPQSSKVKQPAVAKFKDEHGNTWGGRGPRPAWFKTALESGKTEQDLLAA
ncbi:H-NS family nucleoid-associated regulatory protein [Variovorax sp. E3]|uniref:H-NS histone family protein n=1 Tax=Variovorax sp. E3 TaxID=1914993 RepID=UPI0018DD91EC|nr:H-NS histone family protein [Variovorax sp. E3]